MVSRRSSRTKHCKRRRRTQRGGDGNNLSCINKALADNQLELTEQNIKTITPNNPLYAVIKHCKEEIRNLQKSTSQRNSIRNEIKIDHKPELKHKIYNLWLCLDKAIDDDNSRANQLSDCEKMYAEIIPAIKNL
jgi:hypothetical protein